MSKFIGTLMIIGALTLMWQGGFVALAGLALYAVAMGVIQQ